MDGFESDMNLAAILRRDSAAKEIVDSSTHVALYNFDSETNSWDKGDVEGSLFVYSRREQPYHAMIVLNKLSTKDYQRMLANGLQVEGQAPYLLCKETDGVIQGVWFFDQNDCKRIAFHMKRLLADVADNHDHARRMRRTQSECYSGDSVRTNDDVFALLASARHGPSGPLPSDYSYDHEILRPKPVKGSMSVDNRRSLTVDELFDHFGSTGKGDGDAPSRHGPPKAKMAPNIQRDGTTTEFVRFGVQGAGSASSGPMPNILAKLIGPTQSEPNIEPPKSRSPNDLAAERPSERVGYFGKPKNMVPPRFRKSPTSQTKQKLGPLNAPSVSVETLEKKIRADVNGIGQRGPNADSASTSALSSESGSMPAPEPNPSRELLRMLSGGTGLKDSTDRDNGILPLITSPTSEKCISPSLLQNLGVTPTRGKDGSSSNITSDQLGFSLAPVLEELNMSDPQSPESSAANSALSPAMLGLDIPLDLGPTLLRPQDLMTMAIPMPEEIKQQPPPFTRRSTAPSMLLHTAPTCPSDFTGHSWVPNGTDDHGAADEAAAGPGVLTKSQLVSAFDYLLKNDAGFVDKLYEGYQMALGSAPGGR